MDRPESDLLKSCRELKAQLLRSEQLLGGGQFSSGAGYRGQTSPSSWGPKTDDKEPGSIPATVPAPATMGPPEDMVFNPLPVLQETPPTQTSTGGQSEGSNAAAGKESQSAPLYRTHHGAEEKDAILSPLRLRDLAR